MAVKTEAARQFVYVTAFGLLGSKIIVTEDLVRAVSYTSIRWGSVVNRFQACCL